MSEFAISNSGIASFMYITKILNVIHCSQMYEFTGNTLDNKDMFYSLSVINVLNIYENLAIRR